MPTLQTTPWIDWTFPDQAYARNKTGYVWGPAQEMPPLDAETGSGNPFDAHDKAVCLERLRVNKRKDLGRLGVLNTTERSQRYDNNASQSQSHINGKFMDPSYEYSQTAGGLRGGTQYYFYSKEGQEVLHKLRDRRISELNANDTRDFSAGPPKRIEVSPSTDEIDAALSKVLDQFESGAFPNSIVDDMNKLQNALVRIGATITSNKLAQYIQIFARLKVQVDRIAGVGGGPFQMDGNQKKAVRAVGLVLDRIQRLALEINRVINEPEDVRQRAVAEISSRVLGATFAQQTAFGNPEAGRERNVDGANQRDVATRGEVENRERRLPVRLPPPEQQTQAGVPPVRPF